MKVHEGEATNQNDQGPQKPWYIIGLNNFYKQCWNLWVVFLLLYTAVVTPYRCAFFTDEMLSKTDGFDFLERIVDISFIADIFINFVSAYEDNQGKVIINLKKIAFNYVTGFFWIDLLASFPFDLVITPPEGIEIDQTSLKSNSLMKIMRLQRLCRIIRVIKVLKTDMSFMP